MYWVDRFVMLGGIACLAVLAGSFVLSRRQYGATEAATAVSTMSEGKLTLQANQRHLPVLLAACATIIVLAGLIALLAGSPHGIPVLLAGGFVTLSTAIFVATRTWVLAWFARDTAVLRLEASKRAIALLRPQFAFHFSGADLNVPTHVTMWLPYLESIERPFFIIVRELKHLHALRTLTQVPLIFIEKEGYLPGTIPDSVKAVFYANNAAKNQAVLNMWPALEHVQLLHGDSDKPPSYSPVSQMFSKLFVAGQMAIDRYERNGVTIHPSKFRVVGRPQIGKIQPGAQKQRGEFVTVAYMPTWRGFFEDTQFSSLMQADTIIARILDAEGKARILFKPHPMSFKDPQWPEFEKKIRAALGAPRTNGNSGTFYDEAADPFDIYNEADILISDISSVMMDFLYSGKPFLVTNPMSYSTDQQKLFPSLAGAYMIDPDAGNVVAALNAAATEDPKREERMRIREYAFGDLDYGPGELFRKECLALLSSSN